MKRAAVLSSLLMLFLADGVSAQQDTRCQKIGRQFLKIVDNTLANELKKANSRETIDSSRSGAQVIDTTTQGDRLINGRLACKFLVKMDGEHTVAADFEISDSGRISMFYSPDEIEMYELRSFIGSYQKKVVVPAQPTPIVATPPTSPPSAPAAAPAASGNIVNASRERLDRAEKEVNTVWRALPKTIRDSELQAQRDFNTKKEADCFREANAAGSGDAWEVAKNNCWARMYEARIPQLRSIGAQ